MEKSVILRQLFVVLTSQLAGISIGGAVSYPMVLLNQLREPNSTIHLDIDTASWIGSIQGLAGIPSILMPVLMQRKGRKYAFMTACIATTIGWIVAYTATSATGILISECFHGFGGNSVLTVTYLTLSEMIDPIYRNMSMQTFSISQTVGIAIVGSMTKSVHWKTVSIVMCAPMLLALVFSIAWPESPPWLACKGQFDKCRDAYKWLRGTSDRAQQELTALIHAQKELRTQYRKDQRARIGSLLRQLACKGFYIPAIHIFLLLNTMYWTGGIVVIVYSFDIIQRATGNANFGLYGGVIINCILVFGVSISILLVKRFSNKSVLLFSTGGDAFFLACASLVTYLQSIGVLRRDSILCLYCMIGFMISSGLGVQPISFDMAAEVMPVMYRGAGGALYVIFMSLLHTSSLKLYPYLVLRANLWGTFLLYMTNAVVCGVLVWKFVPETKKKTLQEIEDYYILGDFDKRRIIVDEKSTSLVQDVD